MRTKSEREARIASLKIELAKLQRAEDDNHFINHRTQALATVLLTRRSDLMVSHLDDDRGYLKLFVQIALEEGTKSTEPNTIFPFACFLLGTGKPLPDEAAADRYMNPLRFFNEPADKPPHYCLPVLVLMFSMVDDKGYYAWYSSPSFQNDHAVLEHPQTLTWAAIQRDSLDIIVNSVVEWYEALFATMAPVV